MLRKPAEGTPYDAQSLARADLVQLRAEVAKAKRAGNLDALTRAHLDALESIATDGLTRPQTAVNE
jgi:hypothetical protein